MEDRILVSKKSDQIYGTQVFRDIKTGEYSFYPISDIKNVNRRRFNVGLSTIEKYGQSLGIKNLDFK
jgi:hypothetical protein